MNCKQANENISIREILESLEDTSKKKFGW